MNNYSNRRTLLVFDFTPCSVNVLWGRLTEDQPQLLATQPGHDDVRFVETSRSQQRIVRASLESHLDSPLVDRDRRGSVDEVAEQMAGLRDLVAVANLRAQESVQAAGHQRQLQVAVDLHRHGRAQGVHV